MNLKQAKDFVAKLFSIIDERRFEQLKEVFADSATYERPGYEPLVGLASIEDFYQNKRIIISGKHRVEDVAFGDDVVISRGVFVGKSKDGADLNERFCDVYRLQSGKIVHRTTYFFRAAI